MRRRDPARNPQDLPASRSNGLRHEASISDAAVGLANVIEVSAGDVSVAAVNERGRSDRVKPRSGPIQRLLPSPSALPYLIPVIAILVLLAGGGFAALETDTVESYWEGVWWALSLTTTVGFANGTPATALGKALSGVVMVLGFVLLALTTAALASLFVREEQRPEEVREHAFEKDLLAALRQLNARIELIETRLPPRD
jgi:voltage-gated potassium channel